MPIWEEAAYECLTAEPDYASRLGDRQREEAHASHADIATSKTAALVAENTVRRFRRDSRSRVTMSRRCGRSRTAVITARNSSVAHWRRGSRETPAPAPPT